jgi:hypothetical protein
MNDLYSSSSGKGELRVNIKQKEHAKPTTKGVSLSLMQFKNLTTGMDSSMSPAFTQDDVKNRTEP